LPFSDVKFTRFALGHVDTADGQEKATEIEKDIYIRVFKDRKRNSNEIQQLQRLKHEKEKKVDLKLSLTDGARNFT